MDRARPGRRPGSRRGRAGAALGVGATGAAALALSLGTLVSGASPFGGGPAGVVSVPARADAYVSAARPAAGFGATRLLLVGRSRERAYLGFDLPSVTPALAVAQLRVWVERGSRAGFTVRAARGRWRERTITFRRAPAATGLAVDSGPLVGRGWHDVDVTPLLRGRSATLVLRAVGAPVAIASREDGGHAPRLVLTAGTPQPTPPIRAALYYDWYPEAWRQNGSDRFTHYTPSLGFYDSGDPHVVSAHVQAMEYAHLDAAIVSWWGPGTPSDARLPELLAAAPTGFRWAAYYEAEGEGDPSPAKIRSDLLYLRAHDASSPGYLRVDGRFVVFAYGSGAEGCGMVRRWKQANTVGAFVVLKVFPGYRSCPDQPDGWHQYGPAQAEDDHAPYAFTISPGFWLASEGSERLPRDPSRWRASIRDMVASGATFQLITTFNEWGEGTAVESADEWRTDSGFGAYLDALHELLPARAPAPGPSTPAPPASGSDPVIAAAGDIACDPASQYFNGGLGTGTACAQAATAALLRPGLSAVLTLGDTQYEDNAYPKYLASFARSWGRFKRLIRPTIGNHEYLTPDAAGYFRYFGRAAGDPSRGYYSYDLGRWHLISLNSECGFIGGCGPGSPEETWLRADLAAHPALCTLAYWHEPRFSSGEHGDAQQMATIWNDLVAAHVDVVLSGHNHDYERFKPLGASSPSSSRFQDPSPVPNGIREFVVGTGGRNHYGFAHAPLVGEAVRNADTFGVLELTLHPSSYDWRFVPAGGAAFTDAGSGTCS